MTIFRFRDEKYLSEALEILRMASRKCYEVHIEIVGSRYGPNGIEPTANECSLCYSAGKALEPLQASLHSIKELLRTPTPEAAAREEERGRCIRAVRSVTMADGDEPLGREECFWEQALESAEGAIRALAGEEEKTDGIS